MSWIDILDWIGRGTTALFVLTLIGGAYAWGKGILPALLRMGNGFGKRKIAIFARVDHLDGLKSLLLDSKLFSEKNLITVTSPNDLGKAEKATVFLVYWGDWQGAINEVLNAKKDSTALIVYAPQDESRIPDDKMTLINKKRNAVVANMRGRLINDIIVSLISTGYK